MKAEFIFLALVAACSAMRLSEKENMHLKEKILSKIGNIKMTRSETGNDDEWKLSVLMEFASLVGKCEVFYHFLFNVPVHQGSCPKEKLALYNMCPHVFDFGQRFMEANDEEQPILLSELAGYFPMMQCIGLISEAHMLQFLGFTGVPDANTAGEMTSHLLFHGKPLFAYCRDMYGDEEAEEKKVSDGLDNAGSDSGSGDDTTTNKKNEILLNLVRQLKAALRK